jgi:arginine-tRNA-protein transferase
MQLIDEHFSAQIIEPSRLDTLLAQGWRHFGEYFFRYNTEEIPETHEKSLVVPLRIRLEHFSPSKSQRKIIRKNASFRTVFEEASITYAKERMFEKHKKRFTHGRPLSLYNFLSLEPALYPTQTYEVAVYDEHKLIAVSFVDVAEVSFSSVYAMFDTSYSSYSLGIYTLLKEIEFARSMQKSYLYLGYAHKESSFYDYKKKFAGLEQLDWQSNTWIPYTE